MKIRASLGMVLALWLTASSAGFWSLWVYASQPGAVANSPERWPTGSTVAPAPASANLVVFAHPHCPCTRATVEELNRLMTHCQGLVTAHVLFYRPAPFSAGWEQSDLWRNAERIPGVRVHADVDGKEAARFGAATSGQAMLFDAGGQRVFRGGLTNTRGHAGQSMGCRVIQAMLHGESVACVDTAVFGCPLRESDRPLGKASP